MKSLVRHIARVVSVSVIGFSTFAQGTIRFGFEDLAVGTRPEYAEAGPFSVTPAVGDRSTHPIAPGSAFEGQHFLSAAGTLILRSPDFQAIEEFSLAVYVPSPGPFSRNTFFVYGQEPVVEFDTWQIISGTFDTPVESITIGLWVGIGETFPGGFGIDTVEFRTVPEPSLLVLAALGLGCFSLRAWKNGIAERVEK